MRYGSLFSGTASILKVFRLDRNAQPQLKIERENAVERAWVQNGFLITVESHYHPEISASAYVQICLEKVY